MNHGENMSRFVQAGDIIRYEMVSLSLHETNPGHHLQSSYSIEQSDWPMFRKVFILPVSKKGFLFAVLKCDVLLAMAIQKGCFAVLKGDLLLAFLKGDGGQNIQPGTIEVPHQHCLC